MSELKRQFTAAAAFVGAVRNSGKRIRIEDLIEAIHEQDPELLGQAVRLVLPFTVELSWPTVWNLIEACKAIGAFTELKQNAEYWQRRVYEQFPSTFQFYFKKTAPQQIKAKKLKLLLDKVKYKPESNVFAGAVLPNPWYLLFQQCQRRLAKLKFQLAHLEPKGIFDVMRHSHANIVSMTVVVDEAIIAKRSYGDLGRGDYLTYDGVETRRPLPTSRIIHPAFGLITDQPNFVSWLVHQQLRPLFAGAPWSTGRGFQVGDRIENAHYFMPTQGFFHNLPTNNDFASLVKISSDVLGFADGALVNYTKEVFDIIASRNRKIVAVLTSTPSADMSYGSPFLVMVESRDVQTGDYYEYDVDLYNANFLLKSYTCVNGWVSGTMPGDRHVVFNLYSYVKARDEGVVFEPFVVQKLAFVADVLLDIKDKFTVFHLNEGSMAHTRLQTDIDELIACHTCNQVATLECTRCDMPYCSSVCRQLDGSLHTLNCK
jgi:hypothetical protein